MAHDFELLWSTLALEDLARILARIANDNPAAAKKLAMSISHKTEQLKRFPNLGRAANFGVRELLVHRHYLISYRLKERRIEILQVWHTAQQR
jgi:plasmid stabilization system protein ParE